MITLKNVTKKYGKDGNEFYALKNINLTIEDGKIYGIIGLSGAGKSTLVRSINLLERPTEGQVFLNETEITKLKPAELRKVRKKIGMIFQHFQLFDSRTVYENVAFPLKYSGLKKEEIDEKVKRLLELVDLADRGKSYPSELSGGQKQRVSIARALACDPEIILSDEATSALDPQNTKVILNLLKKLNEELGITVVIITHEMDVVKEVCNEVVVMEHGEIVEKNDIFSVFADSKHEAARKFVDSTNNLNRIYDLIEENSQLVQIKKDELIVKFTYKHKTSVEALVSSLSRKWNIDFNIIFGDIDIVAGNPLGGLVAIVSGERENVKGALDYLESIGVGVEVIMNGK